MKRALVVIGLVIAACQYQFDPDGAGCAGDGTCPAGYVCTAERVCRVAGSSSDSGAGGGAVSSDAGTGGGNAMGDAGATCDCARPECAGQVCRVSTGPCDRTEVCTGGVCPADRSADAGVLCAPAVCQQSSFSGTRRCDGAGVCVAPVVQSCGLYACDEVSDICRSRCDVDQHCASGLFCGGDGGCRLKLDNGIPCTAASQCVSGFCADGVCCNTECGAGCDSCTQPTLVGTCSLVPRGGSGSPSCDGGYLCDGVGTSCPASCQSDDECTANSYCRNQQMCAPKKANAEQCSGPNQCASGFCADGVCCNTACGEGCDSCATGTCTTIGAGEAGSRPSCAPYLCNGTAASCPQSCDAGTQCVSGVQCINGTCGGRLSNGQSCSGGDAGVCSSGNCSDGVCCDTACTGACDRCDLSSGRGTCQLTPGSTDAGCGALRCGATAACPTTCTSTGDCSPGFFCSGTTCVAKRAAGAMCSTAEQCLAGVCTAFFLDTDTDGFGQMASATQRCGTTPPVGYVSATGDCCDQDPAAYPGQLQYFDRERAGCGGYDFDCSGTPAPERGTQGAQCNTVQGDPCDRGCTSNGTPGWLTPLPTCGDAGLFFSGCTGGCVEDPPYCAMACECSQQSSTIVQRCR